MQNIIAIPARYESTRLANKPLQDLGGQPLILRTLQQAKKSACADQVFVVCDDQRIIDAVKPHHEQVIKSQGNFESGTDRIAAALLPLNAERVVNLQVDEPFIDPNEIDSLFQALEDSDTDIATLRAPLEQADELNNPDIVKVVCSDSQDAMYFSRAAIPYKRNCNPCGQVWYKHIGIYAYQQSALKTFCALPPHPLELTEKLEQLRALAAGMRIKCLDARGTHLGIDTQEDLDRAKEIVDKLGEKAFP